MVKVCFVIMPFGKKKVGNKEVDFDYIYDIIFKPAISEVVLPEGGRLEPRRTDKDFFAGDINLEMFHYLEYSRFAIADISGLNANVFYELGARHRVRASGTAIFRQTGAPIPFDIQTIKAFPYEYEPEAQAKKSRAQVVRVLSESFTQNRIDSPIRIALSAQQEQGGAVEERLREAENAIRSADFERAISIYRQASQAQPENPLIRMKLGMLLKDRGRWRDALEHFDAAVVAQTQYGEAWREKGIAENKIAWQSAPPDPPTLPAPGEEALNWAIQLGPNDFDAYASLGGVLKRAARLAEAGEAYNRSTEVSNGHPYPLLNALKLRAYAAGRLQLEPYHRRALLRADRDRAVQVAQNPPYDKPWCFFDLAEIRLYSGKIDESLDLIREGVRQSEADWQVETFYASLQLLEPAAADVPGLDRCLALLRNWQTVGEIGSTAVQSGTPDPVGHSAPWLSSSAQEQRRQS
jgi:tetratricopeptide (TPR) repeat protein